MTWDVIHGDCIAVMREMPDGHFDAIVCDPPYGLEFMGRAWDSFAPGSPKMTATERSDHMNRSDSHGPWGRRDRPINPNDYGHRNERCLKCGKWRISSNRCQCAEPEWEFRLRQGTPPAMSAYQAWCEKWAAEALRVLKPGGHLLAMGGTRTEHRMTCAIEDAGFEIRDKIAWIHAQGFPKSLSVSKAIDKAAGAEREVVGRTTTDAMRQNRKTTDLTRGFANTEKSRWIDITAPATDAARQWDGWGTALKPAHENIVCARKPLSEPTVAANVLRHSTGALNVDGCRIHTAGSEAREYTVTRLKTGAALNKTGGNWRPEEGGADYAGKTKAGRWPANLILGCACDSDAHDPNCAVRLLDEQARTSKSRAPQAPSDGWGMTQTGAEYDDEDGPSRYFYTAKASRAERSAGIPEGMTNDHPTLKSLSLMKYLCRLVSPPGGVILDPFCGSGSTGAAACLEGFNFIGIEQDVHYVELSRARIAHWERVANEQRTAAGTAQTVLPLGDA